MNLSIDISMYLYIYVSLYRYKAIYTELCIHTNKHICIQIQKYIHTYKQTGGQPDS